MKTEKDPVVKEIQRVRQQIFKECGYDTQKLYELIKNESRKRPIRSRRKSLAQAA